MHSHHSFKKPEEEYEEDAAAADQDAGFSEESLWKLLAFGDGTEEEWKAFRPCLASVVSPSLSPTPTLSRTPSLKWSQTPVASESAPSSTSSPKSTAPRPAQPVPRRLPCP